MHEAAIRLAAPHHDTLWGHAALTSILKRAPTSLRQMFATQHQKDAHPWDRLHLIIALLPGLLEGEQRPLMEEAVALLPEIDRRCRTGLLAQLAPFLPAPLLRRALGHVPVIAASPYGDGALSLLIPALVRAGLWEEAVAIVAQVDTIEGYLALAPLVAEAERPRLYATALLLARATTGAWRQAEALAIVATALPEPERAAVFREAIAAAHATEPDSRSEALAVVAAALPFGERPPLLRAALEELDTASQPERALWRLAPLLNADLIALAHEQTQHLPPTRRLATTTLLLDCARHWRSLTRHLSRSVRSGDWPHCSTQILLPWLTSRPNIFHRHDGSRQRRFCSTTFRPPRMPVS